uniref:N-acetylglucosamine-6-phosphate deacetylase n=1 Tax=Rhabditophanes sp. KR3021 TaxID=114890 RepID=A0AC35UAU7_9BILA
MLKISYKDEYLSHPNKDKLIQFTNCFILKKESIIKYDLWVLNGKVISGLNVFFDQKKVADIQVDCEGLVVSPGFIDLQLNGGFGVDFSSLDSTNFVEGVQYVANKLLCHGVTAFCPTIITSNKDYYHEVLPLFENINLNAKTDIATILGAHLEGPFICRTKKGAHSEAHVIDSFGSSVAHKIHSIYGDNLKNVSIVTLAPELKGAGEAIEYLVSNDIQVSLGHSSSTLSDGEAGFAKGATKVTHLFNAMKTYHHRDPGLIGLLTSNNLPPSRQFYYGIIADGVHTHVSALRLAYRTNPKGLLLVTDAMAALGMGNGIHRLGDHAIDVKDGHATVHNSDITAGSVASMPECVRGVCESTGCSLGEALTASTTKPAAMVKQTNKRGDLFELGSDADFILIDQNVSIFATFVLSKRVFIR